MSDFATRLKQLREEMHLTQAELADRLCLSYGAIGNYEAGKRSPRKLEDLENIADFFNVEIDYLLGRSDSRPDYSLEEMWLIDCYRNITDDSVREAIKMLLRKYDTFQKNEQVS